MRTIRATRGFTLVELIVALSVLAMLATLAVPMYGDIVAANRTRAAAYSLVSYQTAWLKAHFPAQFMAALLSSVLDNTDSVVKYIGACRDLPRYVPKLDEPVDVLPPDVNESGWKFTVTDDTTWVKPWTARVPMRKSDEKMYEYACHEGNYGMHNILSGARADEQ